MPSTHQYTYCLLLKSRRSHWACSSCQTAFKRLIVAAANSGASRPRRDAKASEKSPVEMPFKYNRGNNSSIVFVRRKYGGRIAEVNRILLARSRTRGALMSTSPNPVWIVVAASIHCVPYAPAPLDPYQNDNDRE